MEYKTPEELEVDPNIDAGFELTPEILIEISGSEAIKELYPKWFEASQKVSE